MLTNASQMRQMAAKMWATGDYASLSKGILPISAKLVRVAGVCEGERVLDVACGSGPAAITARRAGAQVVGIDITPELLARAKEEAALNEAEGIEWREADVEELPFEDSTFDVVLSSVGHMFAPRPDVAAREMLRVTKPGGRIVVATWPPDGAVGSLFSVGSRYSPPRPGPSPLEWGVPSIVLERFAAAREVVFQRDAVHLNTLSLSAYWAEMSAKFGPIVTTVRSLGDPSKVEAFRRDFIRANEPWFHDNQLRLDYLVTRVVK